MPCDGSRNSMSSSTVQPVPGLRRGEDFSRVDLPFGCRDTSAVVSRLCDIGHSDTVWHNRSRFQTPVPRHGLSGGYV